MESSRTTYVPEVELLNDRRPPGDLSLVDIAERLERITQAIEGQRVVERDARKVYQDVASRVEANIGAIRDYARSLVDEQRRRMASFDGMIAPGHASAGQVHEIKPSGSDAPLTVASLDHASPGPSGHGHRLNIYDAIMKVWTVEKYRLPLTTSEIARAIKDVGYITRAAPRSMKSTLNQALAKLCRDKVVRRFRTDGTEIHPDDHHSRARKYMAWEAAPTMKVLPASEHAA
jgi:hypothetical protein